ncbi:MAG: SAM-dependent methyltransferase [Chlamydiota bacterium]
MLYLLPNLLADHGEPQDQLSQAVCLAVPTIDFLIAENEKEARRFLKRFIYPAPKTFRDIPIHLLNEHTTAAQKKELIDLLSKGGCWGLISDCGMPCLADPGADIVLMARERGIPVKAFSGPSSILLTLILSGLGGQHFTFHGYLPKEENALMAAMKKIERTSKEQQSTHLFIETPYRNQKLLQKLLSVLEPTTYLCIACDLTLPTEQVWTQRVSHWKKQSLPQLDDRPAVFALKSNG